MIDNINVRFAGNLHDANQPMSHPFRILNPSLRSREFAGKCALAVMAKAPLPGKVKTRLSPPLTSEQASALNACFLRDTVENLEFATEALPADWVISYTPVGEEDAFRGILPSGALLLPNVATDLADVCFLPRKTSLLAAFPPSA